MRTRAKRDGNHYVLDGTKTFITNGGIDENTLGDCFIVYAAIRPKEISSFLVEKGMPGFELGQKWQNKLVTPSGSSTKASLSSAGCTCNSSG